MTKRVLVALDGSPLSEEILPHVARVFDGTRIEVTLVTVIPEPRPAGHTRAVAGEVQTAVGQFENIPLQEIHYFSEGETLDQAIERVQVEGTRYLQTPARVLTAKGFDVRTEVLTGEHTGEVIGEYARGGAFDLVAMATHGREGMSRLFSGSVAAKVLQRSGLPVMLVLGDA